MKMLANILTVFKKEFGVSPKEYRKNATPPHLK